MADGVAVTACAYCERPARYAVVALGLPEDMGADWDFDQVVEGNPHSLQLLGMPYCSRHAGQAHQWANSTAGVAQGLDPLHGPVDELDEILRIAAEFFAQDVDGPWMLVHETA